MTDFARLHSPDSEQAVLGALLLPGSSAVDRIGQLKAGHFFSEAHRIIFGEIIAMAAQGQPTDPVTVAERLDVAGLSEKTGGLAYLGELSMNTPSAANIGRYAQVVVDKALERELHRKDKALAEAAALLVLAKKYRGLVIPGEDD